MMDINNFIENSSANETFVDVEMSNIVKRDFSSVDGDCQNRCDCVPEENQCQCIGSSKCD